MLFSGDSGALGALALRYDLPTQSWMSLLQPEIFYDAGYTRINKAIAGLSKSGIGQSAGLGLNMVLLNHWKVGITAAKPLRITQTTGVNMGWRGFFNVTGAF
jgi:hemolysin activation/secretion protein